MVRRDYHGPKVFAFNEHHIHSNKVAGISCNDGRAKGKKREETPAGFLFEYDLLSFSWPRIKCC